uniref:Cordon-bleu ubiquitin-like domain-containing protein n=1 Tax=Sphaeramia orbicularis TaxID=375764 RepID=A0A672ZT72_9TELE
MDFFLPKGDVKKVDRYKPVMDLLVTLCASYHLNPSDYTVEVLSPNKNNISFKPNSPIGSLEADKIVLKPKGAEEKPKQPYMPEATVRLLINYNKSHKAVVRVNPRIPLEFLLPQVCDKCEFNVETTILLTYSHSKEPLDMTKTLNDYGLREVFAKDTARKEPQQRPSKEKTTTRGFLSLFRRQKKKSEMVLSAPTSPDLNKQTSGSLNTLSGPSSNTLPADMPKKRRAPQPPIGASQSIPNSLGTCHLRTPQVGRTIIFFLFFFCHFGCACTCVFVLSRSADSTLRSTKRRAPLPPCANSHQELQVDTEVKGNVITCESPLTFVTEIALTKGQTTTFRG